MRLSTPLGLYSLKPAFQNVLRPAARRLIRMGIAPNQITIGACLLSIAAGVVLSARTLPLQWFLILPPVLFVRMAMNAIDGLMARDFGRQSQLGAYLNEVTDVVSDGFLLLPLLRVPGVDPILVAITIVLACASEMAGVLGGRRRYEGPMGKSDRAAVLAVMATLIAGGRSFAARPITPILAAVCALTAVTIYSRIRAGLDEVKTHAPGR